MNIALINMVDSIN